MVLCVFWCTRFTRRPKALVRFSSHAKRNVEVRQDHLIQQWSPVWKTTCLFACALVSHSVQSNPWTETPPDTAIYRTSWHDVSDTYNVPTRSCFASVQINSVCAVRTPECVWVIATIHDWKTCHCSPNPLTELSSEGTLPIHPLTTLLEKSYWEPNGPYRYGSVMVQPTRTTGKYNRHRL